MKRILFWSMLGLASGCGQDSEPGIPYLNNQNPLFAALADTSAAPTPRDSALLAAPCDSGRCSYIEGEFSVPEAMEVVYGLYDRNMECSRWICKARELPTFAAKANRAGQVHSRAAGKFDFVHKGQNKVVLLTETLSRTGEGWESCHACAPVLGAAMFAQIDGAWFVEAMRRDITEIGSWGELPPRNLVQIGDDAYGIAFEYDYTAQGTMIGGMMLVAFLEGSIKSVADVHTKFSNEDMFLEGEAAGLAYAYNSTISFQQGENPGIRDMIVATTGRRPMDGLDGSGPIQRFQEQRTYVMKDDLYVLYDSVLISN